MKNGIVGRIFSIIAGWLHPVREMPSPDVAEQAPDYVEPPAAPAVEVVTREPEADQVESSADTPEPNPAPIHVGMRVRWTSQSGGHEKTKTGTIVAIVPAGISVKRCIPDGYNLDGPGFPRNHESYLVLVPNASGKGKGQLYWPVIKNLSFEDEWDS